MVGVIVLNFNTADDAIKCVESVKSVTETSYRIYVVDNCSTDNSYQVLSNAFSKDSNIVLIRADKNNGFSAGNNIGIKHAISDGCEYICLINADIVLLNDAISILESKIADNKEIGVSAPSIFSPNSFVETQFARNKLTYCNFLAEKTILSKSKRFCKKHPRYKVENQTFKQDFIFYGMTYGCMYLIKSNFLQQTNYLDESVFLFNEEDILAHKLEKLNLKTLITPDAKVIHNHHSSIAKTSISNRVFHFRVSELIVLRKYAGASTMQLLPIVIVFNLLWLFKSIYNKDYRRRLSLFIKKTNQVLKIKKESGFDFMQGDVK